MVTDQHWGFIKFFKIVFENIEKLIGLELKILRGFSGSERLNILDDFVEIIEKFTHFQTDTKGKITNSMFFQVSESIFKNSH